MKVNIGKFPKDFNKPRSIKIKVEKWDTWNLDHTLALIVHPCLVQLKEQKGGTPVQFCEFDETGNIVDSDAADKRWDDALDKMIWSFEQVANGEKDDPISSNSFNNDTTDHVLWHKRLQEGLDLFGNHFRSLWT